MDNDDTTRDSPDTPPGVSPSPRPVRESYRHDDELAVADDDGTGVTTQDARTVGDDVARGSSDPTSRPAENLAGEIARDAPTSR